MGRSDDERRRRYRSADPEQYKEVAPSPAVETGARAWREEQAIYPFEARARRGQLIELIEGDSLLEAYAAAQATALRDERDAANQAVAGWKYAALELGLKPDALGVWRNDRAEQAEADLASAIELSKFSPSPCGHSSQYSFTEDGGKNITCLLCDLASAREQQREEDIRLLETAAYLCSNPLTKSGYERAAKMLRRDTQFRVGESSA